MGFKCAHFADIHFRGLSRHEEYREVFEKAFLKLREIKPDIIYVGGDIVHSKTQGISPELIEILVWWLNTMSDIAPVHLILGNHDGLILNKDRQDAISPIVEAIRNENIFLYKNSGNYYLEEYNLNWCVFSCFDEKNWGSIKTIDDAINVALYHGPVQGSKIDSDWEITEEDQVSVDFFKDYDYAFLGDIHKFQFLNKEETVAYPGSFIQQNYGEDLEKGFLVWEVSGKNEFSYEFIPVENRFSFYTIQWEGDVESTISNLDESMQFGRFRVRSNKTIPQNEIKQLYNELKLSYNATEVVFKWDFEKDQDQKLEFGDTTLEKNDLLNPSTHVKLMSDYTSTFVLNSEEKDILENITKRVASEAIKGETRKNLKWSLKKMKFDNTFGYGTGNVIDFEKFSGITGIFGKNRIGKSSIPGTIMYGLFNTTDRGSVKNLHIINSRKGYCSVELDVNINGNPYRVERQSVKHTSRAGKTSATTSLNLWRVNQSNEKIGDMSGEQRRETEKDLKDLVGTPENFLLTSLASQGSMNNFIKNGATARKAILTKFLDLGIFERMHQISKDEFNQLKGSMKAAPDRDWATVIRNKRIELENITTDRSETETQVKSNREEMERIRVLLATHENADSYTLEEIEEQEELISSIKQRREKTKKEIEDFSNKISETETKLEKISSIKEQFPIEELKEKLEEQRDIETNLNNIQFELDKEKTLLKNQEKKASTLEVVPCGDQYPKCKFIKDSHLAKNKIPDQKIIVKEVSKNLSAIKRSLKKIVGESLEEKIQKYEDILVRESSLKLSRGNVLVSLRESEARDSTFSKNLESEKNKLSRMKLNADKSSEKSEISRLKTKFKSLKNNSNFLDAERLRLSEKIGLIQQQLSDYEKQRDEYAELKKKWNAYSAFMQGVDKKGILLKIMSSQLPVINAEIEKILHGVVEFTVEIEAENSSNALDVFINYGDSRRIIECASGMEKMLSSLAIRVALINVSNLPKSDILIIDEGFGALDDGNIEACSRLLISLKKWFRHILVISHIDAIKDTVDNVFDIRSKGKNSLIVYE